MENKNKRSSFIIFQIEHHFCIAKKCFCPLVMQILADYLTYLEEEQNLENTSDGLLEQKFVVQSCSFYFD